MQIRPKETLEALIWLKQHNPAYKKVEISQENITFYEECNGTFTGCMTLSQNWVPEDDEANAAGPMTEIDIVDQIPEELLELNNPIPETLLLLLTRDLLAPYCCLRLRCLLGTFFSSGLHVCSHLVRQMVFLWRKIDHLALTIFSVF